MSQPTAPALRRQDKGVRRQAPGVNLASAAVEPSEARELKRLQGALKNLKHAGLEYLASEIDWPDVLTRYGADEAADLVRSLTTARDVYDLRQALDDWEGEGTGNREQGTDSVPCALSPVLSRDDLLSAVDANDDLGTYGHLHPRAAIRDAAGELAELRQAGDEVLLYQSEVAG